MVACELWRERKDCYCRRSKANRNENIYRKVGAPNPPNIPPQNRSRVPTKMKSITIIPNNVTGAPVVLEFQKVFLRPAVAPESDIIFTAQELSAWAAFFWN